MPVTEGQRFFHNAAKEVERLDQQARERNAHDRQQRRQEDRDFDNSIGEIEDRYKEAINNATDTRNKRALRKEQDREIKKANEEREKQDNPTNRNKSTSDDSTDTTGSYPENGADGSPGGGEESETFTLDIVKSDNTAGTATFNGPGIN
tara:strand:+ start:2090 stop:2536 length:447 start_codon:yes stop_codon:yes gene_type:complete